MKFDKILILFIIVFILYYYFKCYKGKYEGYIDSNLLSCDDTNTVNPETQLPQSILSLPNDLTGKFIDIDARDKFYLYAVSDDNSIYRCLKPCSDIGNSVLNITIVAPDETSTSSINLSFNIQGNSDMLSTIKTNIENDTEDFYLKLLNPANKLIKIINIYSNDSGTNPDGSNSGGSHILTLEELPPLALENDTELQIIDSNTTSVNWEKVPMNLDYDINKIYSTTDFLWGLNELGEPVYTFAENNAILDEYRRNLTHTDEVLYSYEDKGTGYCRNNRINIPGIVDRINSGRNLENCEELCNNTPDCGYISYSNSLNICNLYKNTPECNGTVGSGRFENQPCSNAYSQVLIEQNLEGANTWCSGGWNEGCSLSNESCETENDRKSNSNFTTYKRNSTNVAALESSLEVSSENN